MGAGIVGQTPQVWELIGSATLTGAAASLSFTGIPTGYKWLRFFLRHKNSAAEVGLTIRLNNDGGANYDFQSLAAAGAVVAGQFNAAATGFYGQESNAVWSQVQGFLSNNATAFKSVQLWSSYNRDFRYDGGEYQSNTEISRIDFIPSANNMVAGSTIVLEGSRF